MTNFSRILVLNTEVDGAPRLGGEREVEGAEKICREDSVSLLATLRLLEWSKDCAWKQCQFVPGIEQS